MDETEFLSREAMEALIAASLRETRGQDPSTQATAAAETIWKFYARMSFELTQLGNDLAVELASRELTTNSS